MPLHIYPFVLPVNSYERKVNGHTQIVAALKVFNGNATQIDLMELLVSSIDFITETL